MKTELPYHRLGCDHDGPCWTVSYDDCWGVGIREVHGQFSTSSSQLWFTIEEADAIRELLYQAGEFCADASRQREQIDADIAAIAAEDAAAEKEEVR